MRRTYVAVYLHFVWRTWDSQPLVSGEVERPLYRYIEATCLHHGCQPLAIGGMPDHVHLVVSLSTSIRIEDLMEFVKGGSSRMVNDEVLEPGSFKWQEGYAAISVSPSHKRMVIEYVMNQKNHHAEGTL